MKFKVPEGYESSKYEIVEHQNKDKVVGEIWWDGHSVQCSNDDYLGRFKKMNIDGLGFSDGPDFIKALKKRLKSGYVQLRKV